MTVLGCGRRFGIHPNYSPPKYTIHNTPHKNHVNGKVLVERASLVIAISITVAYNVMIGEWSIIYSYLVS